jgi:DNA-binding helix-hairpin-helix protein with protein kinase domain
MAKAAKVSKAAPEFLDENGVRVMLAAQIAIGGEGAIFEVAGGPFGAAKSYTAPAGRACPAWSGLQRAIRTAIARAMFSSAGRSASRSTKPANLAGFVMPRLLQSSHLPVAMYWDAADRGSIAPGFTWMCMVVAGPNVASLVELLHRQKMSSATLTKRTSGGGTGSELYKRAQHRRAHFGFFEARARFNHRLA